MSQATSKQLERCLRQGARGLYGKKYTGGKQQWQLKKGMTYEEVLNVMGRQPDYTNSITYGNGVVAKIYGWFFFGKSNYVSASFIDGRLSERGGFIADTFRPDPDISCGW